MNKVGLIDIKKAYLGAKSLSPYNAFVGIYPLLMGDRDNKLRFEAIENSTFGLRKISQNLTIDYSLDYGNTWTPLTTSSNVTLNAGLVAYLRGKLTGNNGGNTRFSISGNIAPKGNIMWLYDYEHPDSTTIIYKGTFNSLFYQCNGLYDASELILPATTLADSCYDNMFAECVSLTQAPELPATTLAGACYQGMFYNCSSLTSAPVLPATTLAGFCYESMFWGCTSLASAPALPATTLADSCYDNMFAECVSLTQAPELPATTLATSCYNLMFYNCSSLSSVPELPATTLTDYCYYGMFYGCSRLSYIKCLATTGINTNGSTAGWVYGVASSGIFVKDQNATWPTGTSGIPTGWTEHTSL